MMKLFIGITFSLIMLLFTGCRTDYDISEVAPQDFLDSESHADHDHAPGEACTHEEVLLDEHVEDPHAGHDHAPGEPCNNEESIGEHVEDSHAGHNHAAGTRNHGTQWFFNQPWAAPFIWGKLFRDGAIFLTLGIVIFIITGRRRRK